jgi:hypothetical protein
MWSSCGGLLSAPLDGSCGITVGAGATGLVGLLVYLAFHLGAGHTHHRYRKAHGAAAQLLLGARSAALRLGPPARRVPGRAPPVDQAAAVQVVPAGAVRLYRAGPMARDAGIAPRTTASPP